MSSNYTTELPSNTRSGIVILDPEETEGKIIDILSKLLGDKDKAIQAVNEGQVGGTYLQFKKQNPLNELKTSGFLPWRFRQFLSMSHVI